MTDKRNPLGPTGEIVRANVQRIRTGAGMSYRELSDRLNAAGRPIPTLGLSRLENGERRVDVDDLVALASALGTTPADLLKPLTVSLTITPEEADAQRRFAEESVRALTAEDIARMFDIPVEMLRRPEQGQLIEGIEMHNVLRSAWHDRPEDP